VQSDLENETVEKEDTTKIKGFPTGTEERTTDPDDENEENEEEDDDENFNEDDGLGEYER